MNLEDEEPENEDEVLENKEAGLANEDEELASEKLSRSRVGRKAQAGGGIAVLMGLLLLYALPPAQPGAHLDAHPLAKLFIGIGVFLFAAGTLARIFLLPPE
jgi:hypothetical protein